MSAVLKFEQQLKLETCCVCGIAFGVPAYFKDKRLEDKEGFYCPNGHCQSYTVSVEERVRTEMQARLDAEKRRAEFYRNQNEMKKRELTATKGQLTKARKRIANGVCPCCSRSFVNLHRHMTTKHPEYGQG